MRLFKCSIINLFLFLISFFSLSNLKLSSSQILNILNSKDEFPVLKAKNIRDLNTLIKTDKSTFVHSYDEDIYSKNTFSKSNANKNMFPFPQTLNEDEITFLQMNIKKEKDRINKINLKQKKILQNEKLEIIELIKKLNEIRTKSQQYQKAMKDFKSIEYKKNIDEKISLLQKLNEQIFNLKIQLNKTLDEIIKYYESNKFSEYFKSIDKAEVSQNLNVIQNSKFDKILLNEISIGSEAFKMSSTENYIRIDDDNTNFVGLIEIDKKMEELKNRCGENFKKCFIRNEDLKNKNAEFVKININLI